MFESSGIGGQPPWRPALFAGALLVAVLAAAAAEARRAVLPIEQWGNFDTRTAACQRAIARAAARCVDATFRRHNACLAGESAGQPCDRQRLAAATVAERSDNAAAIARRCGAEEFAELGFSDVSDVLVEVAHICRQTERAVVSAMWGPVRDDTTATAGQFGAECSAGAADIAARTLRYTTRVQQRALDRIASRALDAPAKDLHLARARGLGEAVRQRAAEQIRAACAAGEFAGIYRRSADVLLAAVAGRADCVNQFIYAVAGPDCPAPECGNAVEEPGEECDGGADSVWCRADCTRPDCRSFASTYDLVQSAIFENRGCAAELCHSADHAAGALDLTASRSYAALIDIPAATAPDFKLVDPGNRANSLLWINLAARLYPNEVAVPLRAMPLGPDALSADEIEVLRLWIEWGGAARDIVVPEAVGLLDACAPAP